MKVLLITDVPPNKKFSGTLLTWHLCKNLNDQNLVSYYVMNKRLSHVKSEFPIEGNYTRKYAFKSREASLRSRFLPYFSTSILSFFREMFRKIFEVRKIYWDVMRFAKANEVDRIWIILQGQTMIWLAENLIRKNKYPVHVQVWDSPKWWVKANHIDWLSAKILYRSYNYVLKHAKQFGSPSFNMTSIYQQTFGLPSYPLIGITPDFEGRNSLPKNKSKIIIGLAGQIYATDTFKGLIKALDSMYWHLDGKDIEIHYWGYSDMPANRDRIIPRGYVSQEELCRNLSECDILYCPYWFDPKFEDEARTSFPSKVSSYLQSGVIVLFHGPAYSSPGALIEEHGAGICCFSNDIEIVKFNIRRAIYCSDKAERLSAARNLLNTLLSERQLHENFKHFLELPG